MRLTHKSESDEISLGVALSRPRECAPNILGQRENKVVKQLFVAWVEDRTDGWRRTPIETLSRTSPDVNSSVTDHRGEVPRDTDSVTVSGFAFDLYSQIWLSCRQRLQACHDGGAQ